MEELSQLGDSLDALGVLSETKRIAFSAAVAERFLSNPYARVSIAKWNRAAWHGLRSTMDIIWAKLDHASFLVEKLKGDVGNCAEWVPHDEDPTWDGLPEAQNAGLMVLTTIESIAQQQFDRYVEVSSIALECIRNYMTGVIYPTGNFDLSSGQLIPVDEKEIVDSSLYKQEVSNQIAHIAYLDSNDISKQSVARLHLMSAQSHYTFSSL